MNTADTSFRAKEDPASVTSPSSPLPSSRTSPAPSHKTSSHPGRGAAAGGGASTSTHPAGASRQQTTRAQSSASQGAPGNQTHHHSSGSRSRLRSNIQGQQPPPPHQQPLPLTPHGVATPNLVATPAGPAIVAQTGTGGSSGGSGGGPPNLPPHLAPQPPPMIPYYHPSMYYGAHGEVAGMQYPPLGHIHGPPPDHVQPLHPNRQVYPHGNANPPPIHHHYPMGPPPHTRQPYPPMHAPTSVPLPSLSPHHSLHEPPGLTSNIHIAPVEKISSQESSPRQQGTQSSPGTTGHGDGTVVSPSSPSSVTPGFNDKDLFQDPSRAASASSPTTHATSHNHLESQHPGHHHQRRGDNQSSLSQASSQGAENKEEEDTWEHEQGKGENDARCKEDDGDDHPREGEHAQTNSTPAVAMSAAGKVPHLTTIPAMGVGGMDGGVVPAVPTYGYPMPFYGAAMPPIYNVAGPRGQMGYPLPAGAQVPSMVPGRSINPPPPPPPPLPIVQPHNFKHGYMGGGAGGGGASAGTYPLEYGGGPYMPPGEHWHPLPPQQSLQKKPKELDKAMWVGNVSSDTTVADLQAIFEAPPTEEEGDIQVDVPESIFILAKSNCAFVNYATHEAVHRAVKRFHDREFKSTRLVCRPRKDPGSSGDAYGSRHGPVSMRYQQSPSHQQHHFASRSTTSVGSGVELPHPSQSPLIPLPPPVHMNDDAFPNAQQQQQPTAVKDLEDKEHQNRGTPGTEMTSMNMDSLRRELSPAPDSVSSGGGGGSVTPRERDGRPRHSRAGRSLKHLSGLKSRSRSSSSSVHNSENRYYILKGLNEEDLKLSVQYGLWATQDHLVPVLNQAFANSKNVYLIFSANKSGEFFGFARMMDSISQEKHDHIFKSRAEANWIPSIGIPISPELKAEVARYIEEAEAEGRPITYEEAETVALESTPTKSWGIVFPVQWLFVHKVPFSITSHLRNPYYDNRDVKLSKDGTEVEPTVGEQLLSEFRKHRELKKSASSGTSGTSSPAGSESGAGGGSRRSSITGVEDKGVSAAASPNPLVATLRRSSSASNKSVEPGLSGGVQTSETSQRSTSATAKSPSVSVAQSDQQPQRQQEQVSQQSSALSPASPIPPVPSPQQQPQQQSSTSRKQGSSYYSHGTGSGHPRSHYTNGTRAGPPSGGGGGYRNQGHMQQQYGPGSYGGSHPGYGGPYGNQWQGKAGPRGGSGQPEYHPSGGAGGASHLPAQNPTSPDHPHLHHPHHHQSPSSANTLSPHSQQQQPYYNPPTAVGGGYDYPPPSGGQYSNQPYSRRRNQGPPSGHRHNADGHASGAHGSGYKHTGGPSAHGSQDSGQGYFPNPNSPAQGGYRMMHPMMNAYPGMPPMMGYQFHHGQSFIPVPIAWHPTQAVPMQASTGDAASGTAGMGSGAAKTNTTGSSSSSSSNGSSNSGSSHQHASTGGSAGSLPPAGGMAMMMGPQGYPAAAATYGPFPGMPTMAQGMSATGEVMMEGMVPTALGYDGVQYMYIPAEMAEAYHQPMYYYGHMPMPAGGEIPMAAPLQPPSSGEGTLVSEPVEEHESGKGVEEEEEEEEARDAGERDPESKEGVRPTENEVQSHEGADRDGDNKNDVQWQNKLSSSQSAKHATDQVLAC
ncbi:hypothetical protein BGZ73_001723 [Actinomortierella ambigua]|nr:hypothetical protein BGZ73_001723 [Actinomortierella ambigua]